MSDEQFLLLALHEARRGKGTSFPNPAVGAILVHQGRVLAKGYHFKAGTAHAEVMALSSCNQIPADAVLYVTLEPCCHHGRTPPCTELLLQKGIRHVVFGYKDPNPRVNGGGQERLEAAGVTVTVVPLPEIQTFYEGYRFWTASGRPRCTAKIATTLDGAISGPKGQQRKISSAALDTVTHHERRNHCALLTTARTILADDPRLNIRLEGAQETRRLYVLDSKLTTPHSARIWETGAELVFFHGPGIAENLKAAVTDHGARTIEVPYRTSGLSLTETFSVIGREGVHDLWIEAGGTLLNNLIRDNLLQRLLWYTSPIWSEPLSVQALRGGIPATCVQPHRTAVRAVGSEAIFELLW